MSDIHDIHFRITSLLATELINIRTEISHRPDIPSRVVSLFYKNLAERATAINDEFRQMGNPDLCDEPPQYHEFYQPINCCGNLA